MFIWQKNDVEVAINKSYEAMMHEQKMLNGYDNKLLTINNPEGVEELIENYCRRCFFSPLYRTLWTFLGGKCLFCELIMRRIFH